MREKAEGPRRPSRREFIKCGVAAAGAAALGLAGYSLVSKPSYATSAVATPATSQGPLIDAHGHWIPDLTTETIITLMDQAGIQKMVLMANRITTQLMGWEDTMVLAASEKYPQRIIPFLTTVRLGWYFKDRSFIEYVENQLRTGKFKGMGEFMVKHYACPPPEAAPEINLPADSSLMQEMMRLGAKYNVPLTIHMETDADTVAALERALLANNNTKVIWAHQNPIKMGGGPEAQYARKGDPEQIAALLDKYPNLYADISVGYETAFLDAKLDRQLPEKWKSLYERFNDRFVAAIDSPTTAVWEKGIVLRANWNRDWLSQLSSSTAKNMAYENAQRILALTEKT